MNLENKFLFDAILKVRQGDAKDYTAGMNYGYALGMLHHRPVPEFLRLLDLLNNAATYAANERAAQRAAA